MKYKLRPWKESDLNSLVKYANNWEIAKYLTDQFPHPYTREAGKKFIAYAASGKPIRIFAIDINGEARGGIGIHPQEDIHRKNAELGYWLAEPFWGNGIVTSAINEIIDFGFKTFDIDRIFAVPFGGNTGSIKVLEKTGFTLEGKLEKTIWKKDRYEDELIYGFRRDYQKA